MNEQEVLGVPLTRKEIKVIVDSLEVSKGIKRFAGMPDGDNQRLHNEIVIKLRTMLMTDIVKRR